MAILSDILEEPQRLSRLFSGLRGDFREAKNVLPKLSAGIHLCSGGQAVPEGHPLVGWSHRLKANADIRGLSWVRVAQLHATASYHTSAAI